MSFDSHGLSFWILHFPGCILHCAFFGQLLCIKTFGSIVLENILPPANPRANMGDYTKAFQTFTWKEVEKRFTWSRTGKMNIAYEAIDRFAEDPSFADRTCLSYEGEARETKITFREMRSLSNRFANVLKKLGVAKGERVFILLPRCPEYYIAMAGCAKAAAPFGPLFEAQMQVALEERLADSRAAVLVTTPRLATRVPYARLPDLRTTILVGARKTTLRAGELSWEEEMAKASPEGAMTWVDLEDPLYVIYTPGSAGRPKGIVHVHGDMVGQLITAEWVLDLRKDDVLWTTADPGWITGTVYGAFAPWLCGVETFVRGGRFELEGWCRSVEAHRISVLYTAPTLFRRLMGKGEDVLKRYDLTSLRHLVSVGEPLSPEAVYWARRVFRIPIHDTWWMTETGMIMIANYPGMPIKPGSIGRPFPGIKAAVIDRQGVELPPLTLGELAIRKGWPAMMRNIWGNGHLYQDYFLFESWFVSGDVAYVDDEGYFYYQGRDDELIKISGVVVGPSEMEDVLRKHPSVADAGIIGKPDPLRGSLIKAFIALKPGVHASEELKKEIIGFVKTRFSSRIAPSEIEFRPALPRSGDGMLIRRALKAWDLGLPA
jgi:acetyl-CoA synthetase